jgi:two-component system, LytTR family, response regulator
MKPLQALLIDDEPKAVDGLSQLIKLYCPEIHIAATANSVRDAMQQIAVEIPNVVFLDVEMPGENGFDLVETIKKHKCALVFVTAHADYAVRAFKADAIDYLLKPVSPADLRAAVARILARRENQVHPPDPDYRIRISASEGIRFISCAELVGIEGDGRYSVIHTADGKTQMVSRNIGDFEEELVPYHFFRVHKSWLVNCRHVVQLSSVDGGTVELTNGKKVLLSRRKRNEFLKKMEE